MCTNDPLICRLPVICNLYDLDLQVTGEPWEKTCADPGQGSQNDITCRFRSRLTQGLTCVMLYTGVGALQQVLAAQNAKGADERRAGLVDDSP